MGKNAENSNSIRLSHQFREYEHLLTAGTLHQVGIPGTAREYLQRVWRYRWFIWNQSLYRVFASNTNNKLGSAWLLLKPLLDVLFYWLVFGVILQVNRGVENFPAFIIIGILMFQFTAQSLTSGAGVMRANRSLIQGFNFPRILPVATLAMKIFIEALPMLLIMLVGILVVPPHASVAGTWFLLPVIFAVHMMFNAGVMMIVARLSYFVPDVSAVFSFISRLLMYGSGVIFPVERFITHPIITHIVSSNPVFIVIDMYRKILIDGTIPPFTQWAAMGAWSLGFLIVGFFYFFRAEERYGSVL